MTGLPVILSIISDVGFRDNSKLVGSRSSSLVWVNNIGLATYMSSVTAQPVKRAFHTNYEAISLIYWNQI